MCVIIAGQAGKIRDTLLNTKGLLLDIFKTNPDGIGVMYAKHKGDGHQLKIIKKLPKSFEQARNFIERMPGDERQLAIHFRWTTHGDTDLTNCHPYTVVEGEVALMHNGVLSTGNADDKTKSDTWHFIKNYLHDTVQLAPTVVFDPGYIALVKDFIGNSNRFVFMGKDGRMTIVNKKEGIEHDGLWFSNTYAWSPAILIDGYKSGWQNGTGVYYQPTRSRYNNGYQNGGYMGMGYDSEYGESGEGYHWTKDAVNWPNGGVQSGNNKSGVTHNTPLLPSAPAPATATPAPSTTTHTQADAQAEAEWERTVRRANDEWLRDRRAVAPSAVRYGSRPIDPPEEAREEDANARAAFASEVIEFGPPGRSELIEALTSADVGTMDKWLAAYPQVTVGLLFHLYKAEPTRWTMPNDMSAYERLLRQLCLDADKERLIIECRRDDGSAAAVAEVISYYLNWLAWPETARSRVGVPDITTEEAEAAKSDPAPNCQM